VKKKKTFYAIDACTSSVGSGGKAGGEKDDSLDLGQRL
jgi:hypothetical protein